MVGLLAVSKRTYASIRLPGLLLPVPLSLCQASAHPHLCRRSSDTPRWVWLSLLWGHCSFPLGSGAHTVLFVPSKSLCFPQSCGSSVIISCCPSKSDSLGIPSPLPDPQVGKWCGAWNLCNSVRTCLVSLFSTVWGTHLAGVGFDCNVIVPLLLLFAASPLCLDTGMFFFGGFQHPPVDGCSTARCDFGVLIGEDEHIGEDVILLFHLSNFQIQRSPTFLVAGTGFVKDSFSANLDRGWGGFGMILTHYFYCALISYYYYISFTSNHQALDPGGWGPLQCSTISYSCIVVC